MKDPVLLTPRELGVSFWTGPERRAPCSSGTVGETCGRDAAEWRDRCPGALTVSSYIGPYGCNSVDWTGPVPDDDVLELVDASYDAAVAALPRSRRPQLS